MNKSLLFLLSFLFLFAGCSVKIEPPTDSAEPSQTNSAVTANPETETAQDKTTPKPVENNVTTLTYKNPVLTFNPLSFTANAQIQTELAPDLSNIVNINSFSHLTENQREFLFKNHFVVTPSDSQQLFYVYEENEYKALPSFITTDSILQLYHVFYDYSLRTTEMTALMPEVRRLTDAMLAQLITEYESARENEIKQAISDCIAYFAVAQRLLNNEETVGIPAGARDIIDAEVALVSDAAGPKKSPLTSILTDYNVFTVRGHYTRNEDFERFFRAMMWYGHIYFPIYVKNAPNIAGTQRSMIIANATIDANMSDVWENIYSPTVFYVGQSDDLTVFDIYNAMSQTEHTGGFWNWLGNTSEVSLLSENLANLNKAQIQQQKQKDERETQFRFMGKRYTPDSDILQSLTESTIPNPKRPYPSALDVAAVLGSSDAVEYIHEYLKPTVKWPEYSQEFEKTKARFDALPLETWQSNMYYGWLWALCPLFDTSRDVSKYPFFAQTRAWRDKSLATALASWTELRHDTVLYVKESAAELGGWPETRYPGYVEPSIEVYERLLWLTKFSKENLSSRGLLSENMAEKAERIAALLEFLITCSEKELRGEALSEEEQSEIVRYGGVLESLSVSIASDDQAYHWYQIEPEADRNMALVVDVHSGPDGVLSEFVGTAAEIYVVTETQGRLILTRGAVFDYFEQITKSRLTDEDWQSMLKADQIPNRPAWTASYLETTGIGNTPDTPSYESGNDDSDYIISDSDTRLLQENELLNMTPLQLKLARNEIYARYGRKFNDSVLQEYFSSKPWYIPRIEANQFTDNMLNTVEKVNVKTIADIEKRIS